MPKVELVKAYFKQKHVSLNVDLQENIPNILASQQQMAQVFINLLNNAVEAVSSSYDANTKNGEFNGKVSIETRAENAKVVVKVSDNGPGIAEEDIPRLFEDFFRTNEARKIDKSGTGLGLSIVNQIVKQHNGIIKVLSKLGEGTTFIVELKSIKNQD